MLLLTSKPLPLDGDLKKMQGEWTQVRHVWAGPPKKVFEEKASMGITGDELVLTQGRRISTMRIVLDSKSSPKQFDMHVKRPSGDSVLFKGIYELSDNRLRILLAYNEKGMRPTDFSLSPNSGHVLWEYERIKK